MNKQEAVALFNDAYEKNKQHWDTKQNFYCGITKDLEQRNSQHDVNKVLCFVEANTFDAAKELEAALHDEGFDTGAQLGHGVEESKIVYMYREGPHTNP